MWDRTVQLACVRRSPSRRTGARRHARAPPRPASARRRRAVASNGRDAVSTPRRPPRPPAPRPGPPGRRRLRLGQSPAAPRDPRGDARRDAAARELLRRDAGRGGGGARLHVLGHRRPRLSAGPGRGGDPPVRPHGGGGPALPRHLRSRGERARGAAGLRRLEAARLRARPVLGQPAGGAAAGHGQRLPGHPGGGLRRARVGRLRRRPDLRRRVPARRAGGRRLVRRPARLRGAGGPVHRDPARGLRGVRVPQRAPHVPAVVPAPVGPGGGAGAERDHRPAAEGFRGGRERLALGDGRDRAPAPFPPPLCRPARPGPRGSGGRGPQRPGGPARVRGRGGGPRGRRGGHCGGQGPAAVPRPHGQPSHGAGDALVDAQRETRLRPAGHLPRLSRRRLRRDREPGGAGPHRLPGHDA